VIVYVTTGKQLEKAFSQWIDLGEHEHRQIIKNVFDSFMWSPEAKLFHTVTGLISFPFPAWLSQFHLWRDNEIQKTPDNLEKIHFWTEKVSRHVQSDWAIQNKLIVKECLDEQEDLSEPYTQDIFDKLMMK
jgi:hypothetical protein